MKIAVTYDNGEVFQHFGHTEQFKIYEIDNNEVVNSEIVDTNGSGHGLLGELLISKGVNALICGGLGGGARTILEDNNIKVYPGVEGEADKAVEDFINNRLEFDLNKKCDHHEHEHEHDCGHHNCGEDKGGCTGNH